MIRKDFVQGIRSHSPRHRSDNIKKFYLLLVALGILFIWLLRATNGVDKPSLTWNEVRKCATDNFHADLSFLDSAKPIHVAEFLERRERLAQALVASNADAFVLEPGYTFQYVSRLSLFIFITHNT